MLKKALTVLLFAITITLINNYSQTITTTISSNILNSTRQLRQLLPIAKMSTTTIPATTAATQNSRQVSKAVLAIEQSEGVGARVRRSIGTSQLKNLTPFLMLDHFKMTEGAGFPDHPHRGQTTVTYMIDGYSQHEDFAGHAGTIGPGDVQWMTAGRGIVHSEIPLSRPDLPQPEGMQLWVDLPEKYKDVEPSYQEKKASEITTVHPNPDTEIVVISGESHGESGPVRSLGGCWYFDFKLKKKGTKVFQELPEGWTGFVYLLTGQLTVGESKPFPKYHTLVLTSQPGENGVWLESHSDQETRGVLIAGEPLDQPVVQYGPFVVTSERKAREAIMDFRQAKNGFERAATWKSKIGTKFMED